MPSHTSPKYTGRFVVRFGPKVVSRIAERARRTEPDACSLEELADAVGVPKLRGILRKYPQVRSYPAIRRSSVVQILESEEARDSDVPRSSLTSYFIADPREWQEAPHVDRLLADLKAEPDVEFAYRELAVRLNNWAVDPDDPLVQDQGYLGPAPKGIGVNTDEVWGSFDGDGVRFVDLEAGWNLDHVDLPPAALSPQPLINKNDPTQADHGTAVLGVVLGQANGGGITGIAPRADFRGVVSHVVSLRSADAGVPDAIEAAVNALGKGGVLLVEAQTSNGYPVEIDEVTFAAIRKATCAGVTVIEAAGNGTETVGRNLDLPIPRRADDPPPINLNRKSRRFRDSGAIMVSGCRANLASQGGHRRIGYAGYGSRIDCYAWGEKVVTAGGGNFGPVARAADRQFTDGFGGTSSAAAIIAGVAILVQQMARSPRGPGQLEPAQLRNLLSDSTTGTAVLAPSGRKKVGVMPDLKEIARKLGVP
jgi:serine protease